MPGVGCKLHLGREDWAVVAASAALSVIIPTLGRIERLEATLERVLACDPQPSEILVHVDAGDERTVSRLQARFSDARVFSSVEQLGPGGARNRLVVHAVNDLIVSLDDDSYPIDRDLFARVEAVFSALPDASLVSMAITHPEEALAPAVRQARPSASFVGCGVAFRKSDFLEVGGYVPLPIAYGMEEADLTLKLLAARRKIYECPWLRVFHQSDRAHQARPEIEAAMVQNTALLGVLRYPWWLLPLSAIQVMSRIAWCIRHRRTAGVGAGLLGIPGACSRYGRLRRTVPARSVFSALVLKRHPDAWRPLPLPASPGLR
jgi:glycosyltransferase involved in cell wall biosynthesis